MSAGCTREKRKRMQNNNTTPCRWRGISKLLCLSVDISSFKLGIQDLLAAVEPIVAGKHIAEGDCEQVVGHALIAEQLKADEKGSDR